MGEANTNDLIDYADALRSLFLEHDRIGEFLGYLDRDGRILLVGQHDGKDGEPAAGMQGFGGQGVTNGTKERVYEGLDGRHGDTSGTAVARTARLAMTDFAIWWRNPPNRPRM